MKWQSSFQFSFIFSSAVFQPSGPVVDLSLHKCSTRRKIPVRSLIHPINVELQRPPRNVCVPFSFLSQEWLRCSVQTCDWVISYHSPSELSQWVRPSAQPGQLPQLQHYPAAPAARHPAERGVQAAARQALSHHAALQVDLRWLESLHWSPWGLRWGCEVNSVAAGCLRGQLPASTISGGRTTGGAPQHDSLCPHPI